MQDEKVGEGAVAEAGDTVVVAYRGTLQEGGAQFDAAKSFSFTLGGGDVIKGCVRACMRVRRARGFRVGWWVGSGRWDLVPWLSLFGRAHTVQVGRGHRRHARRGEAAAGGAAAAGVRQEGQRTLRREGLDPTGRHALLPRHAKGPPMT